MENDPILNEESLKVIRLDNGEILFSKVLVTNKTKMDGYLELHWPMKVLVKYDQDESKTEVALLKWLPFTDTTSVPLAARCIMSVSDLGQSYKKFYLKTIEEAMNLEEDQELTRMSKILSDFEPTGLMN